MKQWTRGGEAEEQFKDSAFREVQGLGTASQCCFRLLKPADVFRTCLPMADKSVNL